MFKDIFHGFKSYLVAIPYLFKFGQFKYVALVAFISLILGVISFGSVWLLSDFLSNWINSFYKWDFGSTAFSYISSFLTKALLFILAFMSFKYLVLIFTAPIMTIISERLELVLTNQDTPLDTVKRGAVSSMIRGTRIAGRNIIFELILTIILFVLGLVTGLIFITTPLIFIIQSYYAGYGNFDFFHERRLDLKSTRGVARSNSIKYVVNGSVFMLMITIPVLGFLIGPALSTTAATLEGVRARKNA